MRFSNRSKINAIFIGCLILLFLPLLLRLLSGIGFPSGQETYHNIRLAESVADEGILAQDPIQKEMYYFNFLHYFLAFLLSFIPEIVVLAILPSLFGIVTLFFIFLTLDRLGLPFSKYYYMLLFLVLSPLFVLLSTVISKYSLVMALSSIVFFFLFSKARIFSYLLMPLIFLTDFFSGVIFLVLVLLFSFRFKKLTSFFALSISLSAVIILVARIWLNYRISFSNAFSLSPDLQYFISDLGAQAGFSMFIVLLFFIGLVISWTRDTKDVFTNVFSLVFIVVSLFSMPIRLFFLFFLCFQAGKGFNFLRRRKWSLAMLKNVTILVLFCGILFSVIVFLKQEVDAQPSEEMLSALRILKAEEPGVVLSYPSYGSIIQSFAKKKVIFSDSLDYQTPLFNKSSALFYSRDLETVEAAFKGSRIKYILIDEGMREGLIWEKPSEGLLFLLKSSKKFINIYKYQGFEIWIYTGGN